MGQFLRLTAENSSLTLHEGQHDIFNIHAKSAVVSFEVREGMEVEHTPEIYLTRYHQVFEDKFESSFLRLDRCWFLALLKVDTHLLQALFNDLRLSFVGFAFQGENASSLKATTSLN